MKKSSHRILALSGLALLITSIVLILVLIDFQNKEKTNDGNRNGTIERREDFQVSPKSKAFVSQRTERTTITLVGKTGDRIQNADIVIIKLDAVFYFSSDNIDRIRNFRIVNNCKSNNYLSPAFEEGLIRLIKYEQGASNTITLTDDDKFILIKAEGYVDKEVYCNELKENIDNKIVLYRSGLIRFAIKTSRLPMKKYIEIVQKDKPNNISCVYMRPNENGSEVYILPGMYSLKAWARSEDKVYFSNTEEVEVIEGASVDINFSFSEELIRADQWVLSIRVLNNDGSALNILNVLKKLYGPNFDFDKRIQDFRIGITEKMYSVRDNAYIENKRMAVIDCNGCALVKLERTGVFRISFDFLGMRCLRRGITSKNQEVLLYLDMSKVILGKCSLRIKIESTSEDIYTKLSEENYSSGTVRYSYGRNAEFLGLARGRYLIEVDFGGGRYIRKIAYVNQVDNIMNIKLDDNPSLFVRIFVNTNLDADDDVEYFAWVFNENMVSISKKVSFNNDDIEIVNAKGKLFILGGILLNDVLYISKPVKADLVNGDVSIDFEIFEGNVPIHSYFDADDLRKYDVLIKDENGFPVFREDGMSTINTCFALQGGEYEVIVIRKEDQKNVINKKITIDQNTYAYNMSISIPQKTLSFRVRDKDEEDG